MSETQEDSTVRSHSYKYPPLTHCPMCGDGPMDYAECHCEEPFTAYNPMEGLTAWGAYSIPKTIKCNNGTIVHVVYAAGQHLVRMIKSSA